MLLPPHFRHGVDCTEISQHWEVNSKWKSPAIKHIETPPSSGSYTQFRGRSVGRKRVDRAAAGGRPQEAKPKAQKADSAIHSAFDAVESLLCQFCRLSSLSSYRRNTRPSSAPHRLIFLFVGASLASQRQPHFVTCSADGGVPEWLCTSSSSALDSRWVLDVGCLILWHLDGGQWSVRDLRETD